MIWTFALVLAQAPMDQFDEAMRWLPPTAETLMVVRGKGVGFAQDQNGPQLKDLPLGMPESVFEKVAMTRAEFVVLSAGQFRYPKGIGVGQYNGASIVRYAPTEFATVEKLLPKAKMKQIVVMGETVWTIKEQTSDNETTEMRIWAKDGWLVMTTNPSTMATVLGRRGKATADRILPETLPEWKHVDTSAGFYAIRHIDRSSWLTDMGMDFGDKQRTGMVAFQRSGEGLHVVSISDSPNARSSVGHAWAGNGLKPTFVELAPGVTKISFPADRQQQGMAIFYLAVGLGFPIAV